MFSLKSGKYLHRRIWRIAPGAEKGDRALECGYTKKAAVIGVMAAVNMVIQYNICRSPIAAGKPGKRGRYKDQACGLA